MQQMEKLPGFCRSPADYAFQCTANLPREDETVTSGIEGDELELVEISMGYTSEAYETRLKEIQCEERPKSYPP